MESWHMMTRSSQARDMEQHVTESYQDVVVGTAYFLQSFLIKWRWMIFKFGLVFDCTAWWLRYGIMAIEMMESEITQSTSCRTHELRWIVGEENTKLNVSYL